MVRYIDADKLIAKINEFQTPFNAYFIHFIINAPTADVAAVIHAKWLISCDGYYPYCSHCKSEPENGVRSKYCSECGARMDKE